MDGGLGDDADRGRADVVLGANARGPDESSEGLRIAKQDDCGRMPVPNRRGGMSVLVRREDRS